MIPTFLDGLDVFYHHAKFGKDRTTRVGCSCENMVFVHLFFFTGRMPRSGDSRYLNLLTGRKSAFLPQGRFVAPIHVKSGTAKGHIGPVGRAKFHANRPQNGKNFHFLVETRLERANPLTDLYNY